MRRDQQLGGRSEPSEARRDGNIRSFSLDSVVQAFAPIQDIEAVSAWMGIPISTLREWAARDISFPARKVGRHWLINVLELPRWWQSQNRGPQAIALTAPKNARPTTKSLPKSGEDSRLKYPNPKPLAA
jgi:hypothetical protein